MTGEPMRRVPRPVASGDGLAARVGKRDLDGVVARGEAGRVERPQGHGGQRGLNGQLRRHGRRGEDLLPIRVAHHERRRRLTAPG